MDGILHFKRVGLDNKTASTNSPWAYIWEGLLSEGFLQLRLIGGLFSGGLILGGGGGGGGLLSEFYSMTLI